MKSDQTSFWYQINKPIKLLAPMAGYTDSAFRLICRRFGADVVMTELISADAIYFAFKKTSLTKSISSEGKELPVHSKIKKSFLASKTYKLMAVKPEERPAIIQLFGKDPEKFITAAKFIEENLKVDGIDINMGCSVRKVLKSGHGAALLKDESQAVKIIKELTRVSSLPISVKTRIGYEDPNQILAFGPALVRAGAKALIIHGRTAKQGFSGVADWDVIYRLKKLLPETVVIGNGDINSYQEIDERLGNLDGVAIGRAALSQPWIFSGKNLSIKELIDLALRQARLAFETKGEHGIIELRKHLAWYFKGHPQASDLRKRLVAVNTISDIEQILKEIIINK